MKNDLLTIGPVTIHGYGLMIGIGVIAAYLTAEYRAKKLKLDPDQVFSLVIWCLIFGDSAPSFCSADHAGSDSCGSFLSAAFPGQRLGGVRRTDRRRAGRLSVLPA